jgi:putative ABC transport system permease protein
MNFATRLIDPVVDLLDDGLTRIGGARARSFLTAAGTLLGTASLVVTAGLAASASGNVAAEFDAYAATEVVLRDAFAGAPDVASHRVHELAGLPGVTAAGTWCDLTPASPAIASGLTPAEGGQGLSTAIAVDAGMLDSLEPHYLEGSPFRAVHETRANRVAVVGIGAARGLRLPAPGLAPTVTVNGEVFSVIGVVDDVRRRPVVLNAVLIPSSARSAVVSGPCPSPLEVVAATELGAAEAVGKVAGAVVAPDAPDRFAVDIPPDPRMLRRAVERDLGALYAAVAVASVLVGGLSIGNTMTVAVLERRAEIGVRRALGFRRRRIAALVCGESVLLGTLGGVAGAAVGVAVVLATAAVRGWDPIISPSVLLAAGLLGSVTGLLGGAVPAVRAARIEPARAVRL